MQILRKPAVLQMLAIGVVIWGLLIYSKIFRSPFVFDDDHFIVNNPSIRGGVSSDFLWNNPDYRKRWLTFAFFAHDYQRYGFDVIGYHVTNFVIHAAAALAVIWFVLLIFQTPRMKNDSLAPYSRLMALLSGWLFISHPVQTEAVTYISQRSESMASLFYLLSAGCYLKARVTSSGLVRVLSFFLSILTAGLAMITKEIAFTLPFALLLLEWVFFEGKMRKKNWILIGGMLAAASGIFLFSVDLPAVFSWHTKLGISSEKYLFTQFTVIIGYLGLLFLPLWQNLDYDIPVSLSLFNPNTFLSALGVCCVLFLGFRMVRRYPLVGFGILWFFLTLSVTSSIVPLLDFMVEHRLYLPSVGFIIALCAAFFYFLRNNVRHIYGCIAVMAIFWSFLTFQRNLLWADPEKLWSDTVKKSPEKARPYANLGNAYRQGNKPHKAIESYQKAIGLYKGGPEALAQIYINLSSAYGDLGDFEKEIICCFKAIALDPYNAQAYSNAGYAYSLMHNFDKALEYATKAVAISPALDEGLNNLGVIYGNMGQYTKAEEYFRKSLDANPHNRKARINLQVANKLLKKDTL